MLGISCISKISLFQYLETVIVFSFTISGLKCMSRMNLFSLIIHMTSKKFHSLIPY